MRRRGTLMLATALLVACQPAARTGWSRATEPLLSAAAGWESTGGAAVQEPNVLYESGTWKMWYTGGWGTEAVGYATATGDPTVTANWTKYASNPVLGGGGSGYAGTVNCISVVHVGSTYYAYFRAASPYNLMVATSSDGITWGTPTTALAYNAVTWVNGWANTQVWNEGGTTWKMLAEGSSGTGTWAISYATSTDGLSWTVQGSGALSSLAVAGMNSYGGPWLANGGAKVDGRYQLWYHAGGSNITDIYRAWSTDAQNWTQGAVPELVHNGGAYETQQVADPSVVQNGAITYLFYSGVNNSTPASWINVATIPMTLSNYVEYAP